MDDLIRRHVHPKPRLTGSDEDRIVVTDPVDRASPQPRNHPYQSILTSDPRRPSELVSTESHPGKSRKKIIPHPCTDHFLNQDPHLFGKVKKSTFGPVLDRVGTENGSIYFRYGIHQGFQPFLLTALVRQKEALVFSAEGGAQAVFKQARAPNDKGFALTVIQDHRQALYDIGRKTTVLERIDHMRIFQPHQVDVLVFLFYDLVHVVVFEKSLNDVRSQIPAVWHFYAGKFAVFLRCPP